MWLTLIAVASISLGMAFTAVSACGFFETHWQLVTCVIASSELVMRSIFASMSRNLAR
jgi:hypothetical protein